MRAPQAEACCDRMKLPPGPQGVSLPPPSQESWRCASAELGLALLTVPCSVLRSATRCPEWPKASDGLRANSTHVASHQAVDESMCAVIDNLVVVLDDLVLGLLGRDGHNSYTGICRKPFLVG